MGLLMLLKGPEILTASGRYLVDAANNPVFLAGFHTWATVQDGGTTDPPATVLRRMGWSDAELAQLEQDQQAADARQQATLAQAMLNAERRFNAGGER